MSLKQTIQSDMKQAMQEKDANRLSVLRLLLAAVFNQEKEKRAKLSKTEKEAAKLEKLSQLTDEEVLNVISGEAKKRKDSIEQYGKGNRQDLVKQEKKELEILMAYLPEQMSEEEIRKIVRQTIQKLGASSTQDTGKVMKDVMPQLKGRADGNLVSRIVQEEFKS